MKRRRFPISRAVKEAMDNLPSGVCYFDANGLMLLCNRRMYALAFDLTGRDLQMLAELREALEAPPPGATAVREGELYLLPDGSVWKFSLTTLSDAFGGPVTQCLATEVTDLYQNAVELQRSNEKLAEINARIRQITENVAAIAREEEILRMKMQVHDQLGSSLLALRSYAQTPQGPAKKQELLAAWRGSIRLLLGEAQEDADAFGELTAVAASLGLRVIRTGALPEDRRAAKLLTAAVRECVTNAVRHAGATELYAEFTNAEPYAELRVTNNGAPPTEEIVEGGGLSTLRRRIENAGGEMTLLARPRFELRVRCPAGGEGNLL